MKRQSELIRALRAQLAATEKELQEQKWVFEQVLQSPSWRITSPLRWAVHQFRKLRKDPARSSTPNGPREVETIAAPDLHESDVPPQEKAFFTDLCQVSLESFLESGALLELPQYPEPEISIVLVVHNRAALTLACLRSVAENLREPIEVVIVDNASSDETRELLNRLRGVRTIVNSEKLSPFEGAKQAARECRGVHLLFLSSAAQLQPGALRSALRTIKSSPDIGAVGGKIILADGTLQEAGSIVWPDGSCTGYGHGDDPFAPMYSFRRDVDSCSSAFLLTPRRIFEQLVGSDQDVRTASWGDSDYCARLWQRGARVVYEPGAAIVHYEFSQTPPQLQCPGPQDLLRARSRNAERRVLFIDDRVPHLWLGSGFPRAHAMQRALIKQGYFITLYPLAVLHEPWDQAYADFPHEVEIMMGRDLMESFLRTRKDYYSTVIISRPHNMKWMEPFLRDHQDWFKNTTVIYDAEAIAVGREIGLRKLSGNPMTEKELQEAIGAEIALTARADCVIAASETERRVFQRYGVKRVEVLGHSLEPVSSSTPFELREGLLFVGPVYDELSPNADSMIWFLSEILPRIRESLGDVPVTIAGVNHSERIREMARPPVRITGQLPSLEDLYARSRVFIAPTRYAAGIPLKVLEAAARGLPVVVTTLLAEQLGWTERESAVAHDAETFAARCVEVYKNEAKWISLRDAALARVRNECAPHTFEQNVREILGDNRG